jgi:hypothetical protein
MKSLCRILLLLAFVARFLTPPTLAATIQEIEKLRFEEAYRLWLQQKEALVPKSSDFAMAFGSTDPQTRKFTPTSFFALTCRLGRDAHVHESFLVKELTTNNYVSMIFDASPRLCSRYEVESEAPVVFDPDRGYSTRPRGGMYLGMDVRRKVWLQAIKKANSQPIGPANGSQPIRSETNQAPPAAGSRR